MPGSQIDTEVVSTTINDGPEGSYQPNVAFESNGVSAARVHGQKYADRARSEDSLTVMSNYSGGHSVSAADSDAMMHGVMSKVRADTAGSAGVATFGGVMTNDQGVTFCNAGDSHIFLVGDKGVVQLNAPQENMDGHIINYVGGNRTPRAQDEYGFISYSDIQQKVGGHARIVMSSDGLLDHDHKVIVAPSESQFHSLMKEHNAQEAGNVFNEAGGPADARRIAGASLAKGSQDDISVISLEVPPRNNQHVAAFLSDGAGGVGTPGSGAVVSQQAATSAANGLHEEMQQRGVTLNYRTQEGHAFDPAKGAAAEPQQGISVDPESKTTMQDVRVDFGDGNPTSVTRTVPGAHTHQELESLQKGLRARNVDSVIKTSSQGGEYLAVDRSGANYLSEELHTGMQTRGQGPSARDPSGTRAATQDVRVDFGDGNHTPVTRTVPGAYSRPELESLRRDLRTRGVDSVINTSSQGGEYLAVDRSAADYLKETVTREQQITAQGRQVSPSPGGSSRERMSSGPTMDMSAGAPGETAKGGQVLGLGSHDFHPSEKPSAPQPVKQPVGFVPGSASSGNRSQSIGFNDVTHHDSDTPFRQAGKVGFNAPAVPAVSQTATAEPAVQAGAAPAPLDTAEAPAPPKRRQIGFAAPGNEPSPSHPPIHGPETGISSEDTIRLHGMGVDGNPSPAQGTASENTGLRDHVQEKASLGARGTEGGMGAMQIGGAALSGRQHVQEIQRGETTKGTVGLTLDAANAGTGGISVARSVAPEAAAKYLSQGMVDVAEKVAIPLMVAQGVYDVATASPEERGRVAGRDVVAGLAGGVVMATGGGLILGVASPVAAGWAFEKDCKIDDLELKHQEHMKGIAFSSTHSHLSTVAENLQKTAAMAKQADDLHLVKDSNGKIDIHNKQNLDTLRNNLSEADKKELAAMPAEKQERTLQGVAFTLEQATEARDRLIGKGNDFVLNHDGKVDLNNAHNQEILSKAMERDREAALKTIRDSDQIGAQPGFTKDETKLRVNIAEEERLKTLDIARAELHDVAENNLQKGATLNKTPEQMVQDAKKIEATHNADRIVDYNYTIDRSNGRFVPSSDRNLPVPDAVRQQYLKDPVHNSVITQVLYKNDGHGHLTPDKVVHWQIHEQDPQMRQAQGRAAMQASMFPSAAAEPVIGSTEAGASPQDRARQQAKQALQGNQQRFDHQDVSSAQAPYAAASKEGVDSRMPTR